MITIENKKYYLLLLNSKEIEAYIKKNLKTAFKNNITSIIEQLNTGKKLCSYKKVLNRYLSIIINKQKLCTLHGSLKLLKKKNLCPTDYIYIYENLLDKNKLYKHLLKKNIFLNLADMDILEKIKLAGFDRFIKHDLNVPEFDKLDQYSSFLFWK